MIHKKRTREIIFRGQLRRKGEKVNMAGEPLPSIWKYGGIGQYGGGAVIYQAEPEIEKFPVYGDTVGQYTGLTDKNGVKIFEGDVVDVDNALVSGRFWVEYGYAGAFIVRDKDDRRYFLGGCNCAVVGNVYDNPELLTEEAMI